MSKKGKARISQCMIVKNEEEVIMKALSWGKGIVSEQIVVDTGSTDRTVEIAEQMGAKVYHFTWIDDFAAAKNFALDKAKYEWIAFLDADEYFPMEDAQNLLALVKELQDSEFHGILAGRANVDNEGNIMAVNTQCRVFRNLPTLRFTRKIHEHLTMTDGTLLRMADAVELLTMYHTGYGEAESSKKAGRNLKLIQEELADHPDDYEMWGYLGQEYEIRDQWEDAVRAFRKALDLMPEIEKGSYDVPTSLAALRLLESVIHCPGAAEEEIVKVYEEITAVWPEEADYDYTIGKYYALKGRYPEAEKHLARALELLEQYGNMAKSMMLSGEIRRAYELLSVCCYNNENLAGCVRYATLLLKEDPHLMSTLTVLFRAFHGDVETVSRGEEGLLEIVEFLGNFYDLSSLKERLFILRAAMGAGYPELVIVLRRLFTPEELAAVDRALTRG